MPQLVLQPPGSSLCGQSAVAMIAGVTLEDSIKVFRGRGRTSTKRIIAALRHYGFTCADGLTRIKDYIPNRSIVRVRWLNGKGSHWIVVWDGKILDSAGDQWRRSRWSSFLEVRGDASIE